MAVIDFGRTITLKEFATAIATVGQQVTIIGEGEPGIGKTMSVKQIIRMLPSYIPAIIDATLLDVGDLALPYVEQYNAATDRELTGQRHVTPTGLKITKFAPNARFRFHEGKPVLVFVDEIGKASKPVKDALLTLLLEHRLGDTYLPEGSIVCGATNLASDNVGDLLQAHAKNRISFVRVAKPTAEEWIEWAIDNDVAPEIIVWVKEFPHALASYTDPSQKENQYIFNPNVAGQTAFVSPRSLEKASHIAKQRSILGDALTISLLTGTIGESAARDMQGFFTVVDKMPTWDAIMADPEGVRVPDNTVAKCICVFGAITRVDKDTLSKFLKYVQRMDKEWQALFSKSLMKSNKQSFAVTNRDFRDWALANQWLF